MASTDTGSAESEVFVGLVVCCVAVQSCFHRRGVGGELRSRRSGMNSAAPTSRGARWLHWLGSLFAKYLVRAVIRPCGERAVQLELAGAVAHLVVGVGEAVDHFAR